MGRTNVINPCALRVIGLASLAALLAAVLADSPATAEPLDPAIDRARAIIRRSVEAHGQDRLKHAAVEFTFRGTRYRMSRSDGVFRYERWVRRGPQRIHELLSNSGFTAAVDGRALFLSAPASDARRKSLNSVVYFASLPYVLEDPAVRPRAIGTNKIGGRAYDTVEVRFATEGGGDDHDDVFRYWFDPKSGRLGYLAYRFSTGQGGVRLRAATEHLEVAGVVFVQWKNFGLDDRSVRLDALVETWSDGGLPYLSTINLEGVRVVPQK